MSASVAAAVQSCHRDSSADSLPSRAIPALEARNARRRTLGLKRRARGGEGAASTEGSHRRPRASSRQTSCVSGSLNSNEGDSSAWESDCHLISFIGGLPSKGKDTSDSHVAVSQSGVTSEPQASCAYAVASQLRRLAIRVREALRKTGEADGCLLPSPRTAAPTARGDTTAACVSIKQKLLGRLATSLEALAEDATEAATECCRWIHAAARHRQQLENALEENERLLAESQLLAEELNDAKQKLFNSEGQRQQLANCKRYQEKFFVCQRQLIQLQHELQTLRQGIEALEASHKEQEAQLDRNAETNAHLKEALRLRSEELAQTKQALATERASSRASLSSIALHEEALVLAHPMLTHGRLSSAGACSPRSRVLNTRGAQSEALPSPPLTPSTPGEAQRGGRILPPYKSFSSLGCSASRSSLRASIFGAQQRLKQRLQQQPAPTASPHVSPDWRCAHPSSHCDAGSSEKSSTPLPTDRTEKEATSSKDEHPQRKLSLFHELAASAAGVPAGPKPQGPTEASGVGEEPAETTAACALQQLLKVVAKSPLSLEDLQGLGMNPECLLKVSRLRRDLALGRDKASSSPPTAAGRAQAVPWLSVLSLRFTGNLKTLLQSVARIVAAGEAVPQQWAFANGLVSRCLHLSALNRNTCAALLLAAAGATSVWIHLGDQKG